MRSNFILPFVLGSVAAVIFAAVWLVVRPTNLGWLAGGDSGLMVGSVLVGAATTAIVFLVRAAAENDGVRR